MNRLVAAALLFCGTALYAQGPAPLNIISPADLGFRTVNQSTSITMNATGGTPPLIWDITGGSLPPGMSISTGGVISGTPLITGSFTFTVRVRDSATFTPQQTDTQVETLTIINPLAIVTPATLPSQVPNQPFQIQLVASGGVPPYSWFFSSTPPTGFTLSSTGLLASTGRPEGTYVFTIGVGDQNDGTVLRTFQLVVTQPPLQLVTNSPLPPGSVGFPYSVFFQATGGYVPYTFSLGSIPAPPGLTLSSGGALSGIPTTPGTYSFSVCVTDTPPPPPLSTAAAVGIRATVCRDYLLVINTGLQLITNSPLPPGTVGAPYSLNFQATGGFLPYTFSLGGGTTPPPGLSLNNAGLLSGTPTQQGNYSFRVCVTSAPQPGSSTSDGPPPPPPTVCRDYAIEIRERLTITTQSLANAFIAVPYTQTLQAVGGIPSAYVWSIASGALPAGLALNPQTGVISGTPTGPQGTFNFTARVTDGQQTDTRPLSIIVAPPLTITTQSLANAFITVAYTQTLQATGGIPSAYVWSIASGALPAGLALNPQTGVISGTPTGPQGTFNFTARVTDGQQTDTRPLSIVVAPPLTIVTPAALPEIQQNTPSGIVLVATGGLPPYQWQILSGALPAGLTLNPNTGALIGNPTATGPATFTAQVRDAVNAVASRTFSVTVAAPPAPPLIITTPSPLPDVPIGTFTSYGFSAQGGRPPYTFSFTTGALPDGMTFTGGQVRGIPTRDGTFRFTIEVTDSDQSTAEKEFSITVTRALTITTESPLPDQFVGVAASISIAAAGGRPPYTFSSSGTLPPGLSMAASGAITGTPTQDGSFSFNVQVRDTAGTTASKGFSVRVIGPPQITTETPLVGLVINQPAALNLAATGGRPAYTFSLDAGSLPAGVSLAPNGAITGTPTQAGRFSFTARVTDQNRQFSTKAFTGEVVSGLTIVTETLPDLTVGVAGGYSLAAAGGTTPYRWSATGLPAGMSIDTNGAVSGTPTTPGNYTLTATVTDSRNATATKELSGRVLPRLVITTESPLPSGSIGAAVNVSFAATGALGPITWSASGGLPPGTSVSSGGVLSGTPTAAGTFSFTVTATSGPQTAERGFQIVIRPQDLRSVVIGGVTDTAPSGQQQRVTLTLGEPYPLPITGTVVLTFQPNAVVNADDPAIQFSSGGRTVNFTIPAGQTAAAFTPADLQLQTGTVAGVITLTTTLQAGGQTLACNCPLTRQVTIARAVPVITNVTVQRSGNTLTLLVTGFSSTREITGATFRFTGTSALQTTEVSPAVGPTFVQYFASGAAQTLGGQFLLTMPFTINGDANAVTAVTVTLTNTVGSSQPVNRTF